LFLDKRKDLFQFTTPFWYKNSMSTYPALPTLNQESLMSASDLYFFSQVTFVSASIILALLFCGAGLLSAAQIEFSLAYGKTFNSIVRESQKISLILADTMLDAGLIRSGILIGLLGAIAAFLQAFIPFVMSAMVILFAISFMVFDQLNLMPEDFKMDESLHLD